MQDIRLALRSLAQSPGFTIVAVLSLALGIGGNTAIFSVLSTLLLKPLPYPEADRIVQISEQLPTGQFVGADGGVFTDWEEQTTQLEAIAAFHGLSRNFSSGSEPAVRLSAAEVSQHYLRVLGVRPALGRDFTAEENGPGEAHHVLVLTHELWVTRFQSDPAVIGQSVRIDAESYTIVGVLPPRALVGIDVAFLTPAAISGIAYKQAPNYNYVCNVIGRLKPGVTRTQAAAELVAARPAVLPKYPSFRQTWTVAVRDLQQATYGSARPFVFTLLASVGTVLLIACANVGNLLLARAATRQSELAVRAALGASTGRLVRQLMAESLALAALGGAVGLLLGAWVIRPLVAFTRLDTLAPGLEVSIDWRVLLFTFGATLVTGLLFGLFPAVASARPDLTGAIKEGVRGATSGRRRRLQSLLIVAETALTVVLLVCAGLLLRSLTRALHSDTGFVRAEVLVFNFSQAGNKVPTLEHRLNFVHELERSLQALPGVTHVGLASSTPMNGRIGFGDFISREERPETRNDLNASFDSVDGDFFPALGVPLLRGRFFSTADNAENAERVVIVNAALARRLFAEEDPLGRLVHFKDAAWKIVGVVGDVRQFSLDQDPQPHVFLPFRHFPWSTSIVLRARVAPLSLADDVRRLVRALDQELPIGEISTLEQAADSSLLGRRIQLTLIALFAALALALAAIGLYGVIAYTVAQRTREIGVRIALGASVWQVVGAVLRDGIRLVLVGLALGAVASYGAARLLASQLYSTSPADPVVFAAVALVLLASAGIACWLPARRATRVNPIEALRAE